MHVVGVPQGVEEEAPCGLVVLFGIGEYALYVWFGEGFGKPWVAESDVLAQLLKILDGCLKNNTLVCQVRRLIRNCTSLAASQVKYNI